MHGLSPAAGRGAAAPGTRLGRALLVGLSGALTLSCSPNLPVHFSWLGTCRNNFGLTTGWDHWLLVSVPDENSPAGVSLQVVYPAESTLLPDGAPAIVVLAGGFDNDVIPVASDERSFMGGLGLVQIYVDFPGGSRPWSTPGTGDFRGGTSRAAVATALRYAADELEDTDGCTLADRMDVPLSQTPPLLHGHSNGGNLAVATLADPELDLPPVSGLITFETPAAPQFVTLELGSREQTLELYQEHSCQWNKKDGLECTVDYSLANWAPDAIRPDGGEGTAYFDLDMNGSFYEEQDYPVWGVSPKVDDEVLIGLSVPLISALQEAGVDSTSLMDIDGATDFWAVRNASLQARDAVFLNPDLHVLIVGTQEDHALPLPDHPHISGLAQAFSSVEGSWVRINPDSCYVEALTDEVADFADNSANEPVTSGSSAFDMEPDESELEDGADLYTTAAAWELLERAYTGTWDDDLATAILP